MATTVHEPPTIPSPTRRPSDHFDGSGGGPLPDNLRAVAGRPPEPVRTGIWVAFATIAMMFAALTSALVVRQGTGNDWQYILLPRILFFNTAVLIASSCTLEVARRRVAAYMRVQSVSRGPASWWLGITLFLGVIFVAGQWMAWMQLRAAGLFLPTNPNSSFFYVLTALHAIHVAGGMCGLLRVIYLLRRPVPSLQKSTMDATSYYWHFMGLLWVYLLVLMMTKL